MDFFRGLKVMADAGAYVNIEIPYFKNLLEKASIRHHLP